MKETAVSRRELLSLLTAVGLSGTVLQAGKKDQNPPPADSAEIERRLDKVARLLERANDRLAQIQDMLPPGPPGPPVVAALANINAQCANILAAVEAMLHG